MFFPGKNRFLFQFLFYKNNQLLSLTFIAVKIKEIFGIYPLKSGKETHISGVTCYLLPASPRTACNWNSLQAKLSPSITAKPGEDKGGLCWEDNGLTKTAVTQWLWNVVVKTPLLTSESA